MIDFGCGGLIDHHHNQHRPSPPQKNQPPQVFALHAVTRVLNASVTVVEARLPPPSTSSSHSRRHRLALIFASPRSSRRPGPNDDDDDEGTAPLVAAATFRPVRINDVGHLEARGIVTTKSTAL